MKKNTSELSSFSATADNRQKIQRMRQHWSDSISANVMDIPVTIVRGHSLFTTEPDSNEGNMGRMQGVMTVTSPAIKTRNSNGSH